MTEVIRRSFYGGMADSPRDPSLFKFDYSKHFDIFADPLKMVPYKTVYANNTGITAATNEPANFLTYNGSNYLLARKGTSTDDKVKIFADTLGNDTWASPTGAVCATQSSKNNAPFIEYKGLIYGTRGSRYVWSYNIGTDTFVDTAYDTGSTASNLVTNGIIGTDGYLYFFFDNKIFYFDGSNWAQALLTIPTDEYVVGAAKYGEYLGVMTNRATVFPTYPAKLYVWNYASPFASEVRDLPAGNFTNLGSASNSLIAVAETLTPEGIILSIVEYNNGGFNPIFNRVLPSTCSILRWKTQSINGRMYFGMNDSATGRKYQGVWVVGKFKEGYPMAVTIAFDYLENAGTPSDIINFSIDVNGQVHMVTADFNIHKISQVYSGDFSTANPISIVEFTKFVEYTKLQATRLITTPLPSAGISRLKYQIDAQTFWNQIFKSTTDDEINHESVNMESEDLVATMTVANPAVVTATAHGMTVNQPFRFATTGALPTGVTAGTVYYVLSTSLTVNTFKFAATAGGAGIITTGTQSGTHTIIPADDNFPVSDEIAFRFESLGGAELTELAFKTTPQESLYNSA